MKYVFDTNNNQLGDFLMNFAPDRELREVEGGIAIVEPGNPDNDYLIARTQEEDSKLHKQFRVVYTKTVVDEEWIEAATEDEAKAKWESEAGDEELFFIEDENGNQTVYN